MVIKEKLIRLVKGFFNDTEARVELPPNKVSRRQYILGTSAIASRIEALGKLSQSARDAKLTFTVQMTQKLFFGKKTNVYSGGRVKIA